MMIAVVPIGKAATGVTVKVTSTGVPLSIGEVMVIVHSVPAPAPVVQSLLAVAGETALTPVNWVLAGTTSWNVYPLACVVPLAVLVAVIV